MKKTMRNNEEDIDFNYLNVITVDPFELSNIESTGTIQKDIELIDENNKNEVQFDEMWDVAKRVLDDTELQVLYMKYYLGLTERDIVKNIDTQYTQPGIRKVARRAINKIRKEYGLKKILKLHEFPSRINNTKKI